MATAVKIRLSG